MLQVEKSFMEEPNVQRAEEARKILKQLDPLLDIVWVPFARYSEKDDAWSGRYALVCTWPQADKRWEMYHAGDIGEPFDVLGYFEADGEQMSWFQPGTEPVLDPLSVMDKAIELLGTFDNERSSWKDRMRKAMQHNRDLTAKRRREVTEEAVYGMTQDRRLVNRNPQIQGAYFDATGNVVEGRPSPRQEKGQQNG